MDESRGSFSAEVQRVWEVFGDLLQHMAMPDALRLDESLRVDDVSRAWLVWSGDTRAAHADAYQFAGGPISVPDLVLGRGSARFRVVRLEAGDVIMYRDSSIALFAGP